MAHDGSQAARTYGPLGASGALLQAPPGRYLLQAEFAPVDPALATLEDRPGGGVAQRANITDRFQRARTRERGHPSASQPFAYPRTPDGRNRRAGIYISHAYLSALYRERSHRPCQCVHGAQGVRASGKVAGGGRGPVQLGRNIFSALPVCQCSVVKMSKWFRELLVRDEQADAALVLFLNELKDGLW